MNKKGFIQNGVALPVILGIVLAVMMAGFMSGCLERSFPIRQGSSVCSFDAVSDVEPDGELAENSVVGTLSCKGKKIPIRYNADYSNLAGCFSMAEESVGFGELGCVYLKATAKSSELISKGDKLRIDGSFGELSYSVEEIRSFENEYQALTCNTGLSKSIVLYYQESDGAGLTSRYNAFVLKEVDGNGA